MKGLSKTVLGYVCNIITLWQKNILEYLWCLVGSLFPIQQKVDLILIAHNPPKKVASLVIFISKYCAWKTEKNEEKFSTSATCGSMLESTINSSIYMLISEVLRIGDTIVFWVESLGVTYFVID